MLERTTMDQLIFQPQCELCLLAIWDESQVVDLGDGQIAHEVCRDSKERDRIRELLND